MTNVKDLWESDPGFIKEIAPMGDDLISGTADANYIIPAPTYSGVDWQSIGGGEVTLADGNKLIVDAAGNIVG